MSAMLVNYDPARWLAPLRTAAPGLEFRLPGDPGDPRDIDAMLTWKVEPQLLERLPNLRMLCAVGAGVDYLVDLARARPGLQVVRVVDEAVSQDVATLAVAGALQGFRDLRAYGQQEDQAAWEPLPVRSTADTTVAILGLGRIGRTAAQAFRALGFRVFGWSRSPVALEGVESFCGPDGLQAMLPQAQVLVCTLPLTDATVGILGADLMARLPRGAYLVNVGRGEHLDEAALLAALDSGQVAGAFLDVFAQEPLPPGHPFWRHPAVRVTPHVASRTQPRRVAPQVVENLRRLRAGEPLLNLVDLGVGY